MKTDTSSQDENQRRNYSKKVKVKVTERNKN